MSQYRVVKVTINLPCSFPDDWDDDMINFQLNESSWCCDNYISKLHGYANRNTCICSITSSAVLPGKYDTLKDADKAAFNITEKRYINEGEIL